MAAILQCLHSHLDLLNANLHLHQLVMFQRQFNLGVDRLAQSLLADPDDRIQVMGQAFQVLFLRIAQGHVFTRTGWLSKEGAQCTIAAP